MSRPIEPCLEAEMLAETIRRSARDMNRDQLLAIIDKLTEAYAGQRAAVKWAVMEAGRSWMT